MYSAQHTFQHPTNQRPRTEIRKRRLAERKGGFPHSEICGSKGARASPHLIAACHVLHRLPAPRHPLEALSRLIVNSAKPMHDPKRLSAKGPTQTFILDVR
jgi:hypothetical protein